MSHHNNSEVFEWKCDRCHKLSNELEKCSLCSRFICKECLDEYSGLCTDCTMVLAKGIMIESVQRLLDKPEEIEIESLEDYGSKCKYCGADVWNEESEYGEIDDNLRKYGYVVCPKCGMTLFPEDLVDE